METLPFELLEVILSYLSPLNRLYCGLTCRSLAQVTSTQHMLGGIQLSLRNSSPGALEDSLITTRRQYRRIVVEDLSAKGLLSRPAPELWKNIGAKVRELEMSSCYRVSPKVFYHILWRCPELESLDITGLNFTADNSSHLLYPPEGICFEKVQRSLRNVRHLSLTWADPELLHHFVWLMPNVKSLVVEERSESLFRFPGVPFSWENSNHMFVKLDFSHTFVHDDVMAQLLKLSSGSLEDLRLGLCIGLSERTWKQIGTCKKLRHLSLPFNYDFEDCHLRTITQNASRLEYLDLRGIDGISMLGLQFINALTCLRHLALPSSPSMALTTWRDLGKLSSLRHLDLGSIACRDAPFSHIAGLKELRTLILNSSENGPSSKRFAVICENLKKLERLELGSIHELDDSDGAKFSHFEQLKHLKLGLAMKFTDRAFESGFGSSAMETLSIREANITDAALASIAASHPCLKYLELGECAEVTDDGLGAFLQKEPYLRRLKLAWCPQLTDRTLQTLNFLCPLLSELQVKVSRMSHLGIARFEIQRPLVKVSFVNLH